MANLKDGDKAPLFSGKDQNGNMISLVDYKGKTVVLYFYPKDDTPGCTAEACNLRDNHTDLLSKGIIVIGVSKDNEKSHQKFINKYSLPFSLLADTDLVIQEQYGVWVEKSMYGKKYMGTARVTFVIGSDGIIKKVIDKVDTKDHTKQVLEAINS